MEGELPGEGNFAFFLNLEFDPIWNYFWPNLCFSFSDLATLQKKCRDRWLTVDVRAWYFRCPQTKYFWPNLLEDNKLIHDYAEDTVWLLYTYFFVSIWTTIIKFMFIFQFVFAKQLQQVNRSKLPWMGFRKT